MWVSVCHYGCSGNAVILCLLLAEPPAVSSVCWEMFCKVFRRSVSHIVDSCMEFQLLQICCWFSCAVLDTCCLLVLDSHISTNRFFRVMSQWNDTNTDIAECRAFPLLSPSGVHLNFQMEWNCCLLEFKAKPAPAALQLCVLIEFTNREMAHFTRILACNQQRPFPCSTEFQTYWREDSCILHGKKDKGLIDSLLAGWKPRPLQ